MDDAELCKVINGHDYRVEEHFDVCRRCGHSRPWPASRHWIGNGGPGGEYIVCSSPNCKKKADLRYEEGRDLCTKHHIELHRRVR